MRTEEFDYHLPPQLIAQHPSDKRDHSKMMILDRQKRDIEHKYFYNIVEYLNPDDLLVVNNTKVIPARIFGKKETGANIEIFLLRKLGDTDWQCLLRPYKRVKPGMKIILNNGNFVKVLEKDIEDKWIIETHSGFDSELNEIGNMPLPPYIKRERENEFVSQDLNRYQTIYAKEAGAVAAPTAGLHFTPEIMNNLIQKGIKVAEISLHVGLGTFKPVKCQYIQEHVMHSEFFTVSREAAELINQQKLSNKRIIAVGTTSIRTLETVANFNNGKIEATSGWSKLFIYPGYNFKMIDACITNFHLPKSTLIMLISAFTGKDFIFNAYQDAINNNYRFYSYGDCMLIK